MVDGLKYQMSKALALAARGSEFDAAIKNAVKIRLDGTPARKTEMPSAKNDVRVTDLKYCLSCCGSNGFTLKCDLFDNAREMHFRSWDDFEAKKERSKALKWLAKYSDISPELFDFCVYNLGLEVPVHVDILEYSKRINQRCMTFIDMSGNNSTMDVLMIDEEYSHI